LVRLTSFEVLKDLAKDSNEARCKLKQLARKIKEIENEKSVLQLLSTNRPPVDEILKCIQILLKGNRC